MKYLRSKFENGSELIESFYKQLPCDRAICRDGRVIKHPEGRIGLSGMILEVWYDQVYTSSFYSPKPEDVVLDFGANIGLFSIFLSSLCSSTTILAFEPYPTNFQLLRDNLQSLKLVNVQPFQMAVSGEIGTSVIVEESTRSQDHRLQSSTTASPNGQVVESTTLGKVLKMTNSDRIAFVKCDIEGSEYDLFQHASTDDLRKIDKIAIEYHDNIRPGTKDMVTERLCHTHTVTSEGSNPRGCGMMYAEIKS